MDITTWGLNISRSDKERNLKYYRLITLPPAYQKLELKRELKLCLCHLEKVRNAQEPDFLFPFEIF